MATSQYPHLNEDQFAGLLQVATAAADAQERRASALGKRKREDEEFIDHQLRTPAADVNQDEDASNSPMLQSSAAVLFREPSEKSKKYSRPPLGKVYTDLELAPEMFLQLQSAAKDFMLDPEHPERKGVVGQKKQNSNNNDVAKLKLWNCVEQFLHTPHEKTGEMNCDFYFGHNAGTGIPNQPLRTFFWPEDRDQVIKMCMPLFRKMVTNERQRVYASETRKQDPRKLANENQDQSTSEGMATAALSAHYQTPKQQSLPTSGEKGSSSEKSNMFLSQTSQQTTYQMKQVVLHINIVAKPNPMDSSLSTQRLTPRFSIPAPAAQSPRSLLNEVQKRYDLSQHQRRNQQNQFDPERDIDTPGAPIIKAWLDQGLLTIRNDNEWLAALLSAETIDWMDAELKVLIEV